VVKLKSATNSQSPAKRDRGVDLPRWRHGHSDGGGVCYLLGEGLLAGILGGLQAGGDGSLASQTTNSVAADLGAVTVAVAVATAAVGAAVAAAVYQTE